MTMSPPSRSSSEEGKDDFYYSRDVERRSFHKQRSKSKADLVVRRGPACITELPRLIEEDEKSDAEDDQSQRNLLQQKTFFSAASSFPLTNSAGAASPRWSTWRTRAISGSLMIGGLAALLMSGAPAIVGLVVVLQFLVFREVISIAHYRSKEKKIPWYFLFVTNYFLYGESLIHYCQEVVYVDALFLHLAVYHRFISFCLYVLGIIIFVCNLKKGHYKFQFGQLAFTHMTLLLVVFQSHFIIHNIFEGMIWFLLPVALVVFNDIMAYVFGCSLGRTPLIKLSPKKTWEGFLGAFITTLIFGFLFAGFLAKYPYMHCPITNVWTSPFAKAVSCSPNPLFVTKSYKLPAALSSLLRHLIGIRMREINLYPVQWHAVMLAIFASAIAPFGGFFASGFKRAFKLKDFSDSIPGHGGITDRMDCQFLNGLFTHVYLSSFIKTYPTTVGAILQTIVNGLTLDQQLSVYLKLQEYLIGQGVIADL